MYIRLIIPYFADFLLQILCIELLRKIWYACKRNGSYLFPNAAFVVLCSFIAHTSYSCSFYLQKHSNGKTAGTDMHVEHSTITRSMLVRGTTSVVQLGVHVRLDVPAFLWWSESGATLFFCHHKFVFHLLQFEFECCQFPLGAIVFHIFCSLVFTVHLLILLPNWNYEN